MMKYSKLSKKANTFRTFTGLNVPEFDKLFSFVKREYPKYEAERLNKRERTNALGQGRPFNLELIDRLLMLMAYYKLYTSLMLVGFLFNLDQSSVSRDIKHLEPLVQRCIPLPKKVYKKTKKIGTLEELIKYYPELKAFIDATEQQVPRPKNRRKRKSHYSGKKKKHTVKTQLMVNKKGLILHKTTHDKGKRHDYQIFKKKHPKTPKYVEKILDLGYQGIKNDFPDMNARIPKKKRKGKARTRQEKKFNRKLSRERVVVEHVIGKTKKFGILSGIFRNRLSRYDDVSSTVYGLVNFRTMLNEGFDLSEFIE
jgi:hypothetical protein